MRSNKTLKFFSAYVKKLPHLTLQEKEVVVRRLRKATLVTIGKLYGVTEGRVRQIEKKAIAKIRSKKRQLSLFKKV
jgi:DNA-directed RNA polymerase sigma subunit (sigma70/sigma32)